MPNATVEKVKGTLNRPVWSGGRTLYLGEIICLIIAALVFYFKPLGRWVSLAIAVAVIVLAMVIW